MSILTSRNNSSFFIVIVNQSLEGFLNVIFTNTINRSMIDKQSDECIQVNSINVLPCLSEIAEFNFFFHIAYFLLSRIVTHSSHQIWQFI
jgi:hypothetical protein